MSGKSVILFHSTNYAMWAVDILTENNIVNKLIPVPRDLSSDCGYCVQIEADSVHEAEESLKKEN
ncbi:MAG: DUF3343 domain-containing protein, partial [Candidatus Delongbacteria bacterium]|nr:DUF3343 domain-containing protein [Candidatus Delongbacteria bacterium]